MWTIKNTLKCELEVGSALWDETIKGRSEYESDKTGLFGDEFKIVLKVKGNYYNRKETLIRTAVSHAKDTVVLVKIGGHTSWGQEGPPVTVEITDNEGRKESHEVSIDFPYINAEW